MVPDNGEGYMFTNVDQVWDAVNSGKVVHWVNLGYIITVETAYNGSPQYTLRNGKVLRITHKDTYFGSLLTGSELPNLFMGG